MSTRANGPKKAPAGPLEAYVLHSYDWSESSLILDVFTRERGRMAVAAKGAKRPYSQFRSVLLPFQRLHMGLARKASETADEHSEVHTLRQAEWAGGLPMLSGAALFRGFYCNELIMKLLARQDPHPALFDAYAATLPGLVEGSEPAREQAALRAFELLLLRETGLLPDLSMVTLTVQPVVAQQAYALVPEAGVMAMAPASPSMPGREDGAAASSALTGAQLLQLQAALEGSGSTMDRVGALQKACLPALAPLRSALRALLHYHAGTSTLRTRTVMQGVQNLITYEPTRRP